ncbi:response regulator [Motiliproteus sp.]|uniref:response regulator n=1 Tax=Motiliproteus sp. TaxID=1898955 RepID=UPI003BAC6E83
MHAKQILVVEDEQRVAELLRDYLHREGYQVHCLFSGSGVIDWVKAHRPDLILLDQMLPERDGLSLLQEMRTFTAVPVLMATARTEEIDRLLGLESGADDYICKPYSFREVVARVKAVLRRQPGKMAEPSSEAGAETDSTGTNSKLPLQLDEGRCCAKLHDREVLLTVIEFRLLQALLQRPGQILTREQLMNRIYPDSRIVSDRTIDSHIRKLRAKLADEGGRPSLIRSVYSAGYQLDLNALD